jgi:hypothetical protein
MTGWKGREDKERKEVEDKGWKEWKIIGGRRWKRRKEGGGR